MFKKIDTGIASNIHNIKKWPQKCHSGGETGIYHEKNTISLKVMNSHANPISARQWWCLLCYHTHKFGRKKVDASSAIHTMHSKIVPK